MQLCAFAVLQYQLQKGIRENVRNGNVFYLVDSTKCVLQMNLAPNQMNSIYKGERRAIHERDRDIIVRREKLVSRVHFKEEHQLLEGAA